MPLLRANVWSRYVGHKGRHIKSIPVFQYFQGCLSITLLLVWSGGFTIFRDPILNSRRLARRASDKDVANRSS